MKKQDELLNINSCLRRAEMDEPIFVLRANDELAPSIVDMWADLYQHAKCGLDGKGMTEKQVEKVKEARELAREMRRWKAEKELPNGIL